jgi:hypothetical protein
VTVPDVVKLYLRPFEDGSYLLRLHNMHPYSPVSIMLFSTLSIWEMDGELLSTLWQPTSFSQSGSKNNINGTNNLRLPRERVSRLSVIKSPVSSLILEKLTTDISMAP